MASSGYPSTCTSLAGTHSDVQSVTTEDQGELDGTPEQRLIVQYWKYPKGRKVSALVLHMNFYVDSDRVYIPCEIAVAAFSVKHGLKDSFWTLINPGEIPTGHGVEAVQNGVRYGIPLSSATSNKFCDYRAIAEDLELFFTQYVANYSQIFLFCSYKQLAATKAAMDWLYIKAGLEKFDHEILPLETLLVTLSLAGLETLAEDHGTDLESVLSSVQSVVSKCSEISSKGGKVTLDSIVPSFQYSSYANNDPYSYLKQDLPRVASKCVEQPEIVLGAFLTEEGAAKYFHCLDYAYLEDLACEHHRHGVASERMIHCALSVAKRFVFLTLDVLLLNYGVKPKAGRHYPASLH